MKRKNIKQEIKEYFLNNPTSKLRVRGIERKLKLSLPSVIRYCKELKQEKIITVEKIENITFYTANRSNKTYLLEKKLHNIKTIYDSGIIDYLKKELNNPGIVLFGSYAKGEDLEESDIDLYLETPSTKKLKLTKFKKVLNKNIQIIQNKNLNKISNPHLANNIINGITLNYQIKVFK